MVSNMWRSVLSVASPTASKPGSAAPALACLEATPPPAGKACSTLRLSERDKNFWSLADGASAVSRTLARAAKLPDAAAAPAAGDSEASRSGEEAKSDSPLGEPGPGLLAPVSTVLTPKSASMDRSPSIAMGCRCCCTSWCRTAADPGQLCTGGRGRREGAAAHLLGARRCDHPLSARLALDLLAEPANVVALSRAVPGAESNARGAWVPGK